jgi:hypothetical protein
MSKKKKKARKEPKFVLFYIPGWLYRKAGYILTGIVSVGGGAYAGWVMYRQAGLGSAIFWGVVVFLSAWLAFWFSYKAAEKKRKEGRR